MYIFIEREIKFSKFKFNKKINYTVKKLKKFSFKTFIEEKFF
jgi:hypothetical protein